jgi:hypothetical protein
MNSQWMRAVTAGVAATAVMTFVGVRIAPLMGIPRMNPAEMLAGPMGGSLILGWAGHVMVGMILALIYVLVAPRLLGPPWLRGALYSLAPWLMAQLVVIPMMGMPVFSGSAVMAMGSLVGHLVYGVVLGAMVGHPGEAAAEIRVARARSLSV